ncbi:Tetratricopeptide repeat protein 7B [Hypsibius exemplaris]|uniref:Tetratricopeptide repeat protein 7B n=1 Tax=Hypsibius exemplaris TaxID=2072580 RepID=A0A1W0WKF0_HYPEX|nr:Tetratricopeptide repeat protein 7B [Hypsibius exemplaris]
MRTAQQHPSELSFFPFHHHHHPSKQLSVPPPPTPHQRKSWTLQMDFERLRQDGLWEKAIALCEQQKQHNGMPSEPLHNFYLCEARLERLAEAIPERRTTTLPDGIQRSLVDLKNALGTLLRTPLPIDVQRLVRILIAKICFLLGDLNDCLIGLEKCDLPAVDLPQETNRRNLKLLAEAFALKGWCLTKLSLANAKLKRSERSEKLMTEFEVSNDIALRCANITDTAHKDANGSTELSAFYLGGLLEEALVKCPNLFAKNGWLSAALVRFRDTLRAVETPATRRARLRLSRQLLELLLRCFLGSNYVDPRMTERQTSAGESATLHVPRPKKYPASGGAFVPVSLLEEVILLLQICEAVVVREMATRAGDEGSPTRRLLLAYSVAVSDACVVAYSRLSQVQLGLPFIERAAKLNSNSPHIWRQYAMYCVIKGDYRKALHVLEQCFRVMPTDRTIYLFAARISIDYLLDLDRGIKYAEALCQLAEKSRFGVRARLLLGTACSVKASRVRDLDGQAGLRATALKHFLHAEADDPGDFLVHYHLALEYCLLRQLQDAFRAVKKCLRINMDFLPAHHLLALLLSCWKRYEEALNVLEKVEMEFEEDIEVGLTKIRLQAAVKGADDALRSCRHVLTAWKKTYEHDLQDSDGGMNTTISPETLQLPTSPLTLQLATSPLPQQLATTFHRDGTLTVSSHPKGSPSSPGMVSVDRGDAASFRGGADSIATVPRTDGAPGTRSEMASTTGSYLQRNSPQRAFMMQLNIWTLMAELYMSLEQPDSALECLAEAAIVAPPSHLVYHLQGVIALKSTAERRTTGSAADEARRYFEDALAINPWYAPSHIQMGRMQRRDLCFPEAERHFRAALLGDTACHEAWAALGELYVEKGNDDLAMECLEKARTLETTKSIQPFANLPRCVSY